MISLKKILFFLISFFLFCLPVLGIEFNLESQNALLYNIDENKVLYAKDSLEKVAIASMTKVMSAIVALENIPYLDQKVILTNQDFLGLKEANLSVAGLKVGQRVTYEDLLYCLLLPSGADAAAALVNNIASSKAKFVAMMNAKAKEIGMNNTHFANETGLDDKDAYSTMEDVVIMFNYALKNPTFKKIITTSTYTTSDKSLTVKSTTKETMKKANLEMDYLLGGKTGTTKQAGKCLVSYANLKGTNLILVTGGSNNSLGNVLDHKKIYDYFLNNYSKQTIIDLNELILSLDTKYLKQDQVNFYAKEKIERYLPNDFNKSDLEYEYKGIDLITKKNTKNAFLGVLSIKYQDETLANIDIFLEDSLEIDYLKIIASKKIEIISIFLILFLGLIILKRKNKSF